MISSLKCDRGVFACRVKPCYHPGPCNPYSNCACYNARQRCKRTCRCLKTCMFLGHFVADGSLTFVREGNLRFKGCKCSRTKCAENSACLCQKLGRECDPELCLKCDARFALQKLVYGKLKPDCLKKGTRKESTLCLDKTQFQLLTPRNVGGRSACRNTAFQMARSIPVCRPPFV